MRSCEPMSLSLLRSMRRNEGESNSEQSNLAGYCFSFIFTKIPGHVIFKIATSIFVFSLAAYAP